MRIVSLQFQDQSRTAVVESCDQLRLVNFIGSTYDLVCAALDQGITVENFIRERSSHQLIDYKQALDLKQILIPLMPHDTAHCLVSGTGLTHKQSASTRNAMHQSADLNISDSMRMFNDAVEAGKPAEGSLGAQPEWFYKGDGSWVVAPGATLHAPSFAQDAGEEPEIVALYVNDKYGNPHLIGYCLGNEFSDHILEKKNYLLLAHSKLRQSSMGPEILLGELPQSLSGTSAIYRNQKIVWSKEFHTGQEHMVHSIANLMGHHFKYDQFKRPRDVNLHFLGTSTLSFADNFQTQSGDVFSISIPEFGRPLINPVQYD